MYSIFSSTIFSSDSYNFFYTSTLRDRTTKLPYLLKGTMTDFAIDYVLDKLCWITSEKKNSSLREFNFYIYINFHQY